MPDDLEQVKDSLDDLSDKIDRMKDGTGPQQQQDDHRRVKDQDTSRTETEKDRKEEKTAPATGQSSDSEDPHPSDIERFREKLDHGHEAADEDHHQEAQRIYHSLIQDYRRLKSRNELSDKDEKRLHELYTKVDRAKE